MSTGPHRMPPHRTRATAVAIFTALAAGLVGIGSASARDGGIGTPDPPEVRDVTCAERCLDVRTVAETGRIEITGRSLADIEKVRFPARDGRIAVEPSSVSGRTVVAKVPTGAASGRVVVATSFGTRASSPQELKVKPEDSITSVAGFAVRRADTTPEVAYFDGRDEIELDYLFAAEGPADVRIDVVSKASGKTVDSIVQRKRRPFSNQTVSWNGRDQSGKPPRNGKYRFEVSALAGSGRSAAAGFEYYDHIFPLRGRHSYGDGLGAGRNHQGQDVFAKCGTKVVAARGGRIQVNDSHPASGYYVVVDGTKTGKDYAYMHLEKRGRPREGSRVRTGEVIGYESDSGNASGCHLHFELWSSPGWYEGGRPLNPTKPLKQWDRWS